jgi:hypothetical protein
MWDILSAAREPNATPDQLFTRLNEQKELK